MTTPTPTLATPGGALRRMLIAAGLYGANRAGRVEINGRVFRDAAPEGATLPYLTFADPVGDAISLMGDSRVLARKRSMTLDLWQLRTEESDELLAQVEAAVDTAVLDTGDGNPWRVRRLSTARLTDPTTGVVHHAITVSASHRT